MKRNWTAKERAFVQQNWNWTAKRLAETLRRSVGSVRMAKKRYNATRDPERVRAKERCKWWVFYRRGFSDALIAWHVDRDAATIRRWRLKNKLPPNGWSETTRKKQAETTARSNARRRKTKC